MGFDIFHFVQNVFIDSTYDKNYYIRLQCMLSKFSGKNFLSCTQKLFRLRKTFNLHSRSLLEI